MPIEKRAVLIAGPTASGKSALALKIAQQRNGVIINADALQVYRELRILTARPTVDDEALVQHCLYGHVSATKAYSAAIWLADAGAAIQETWSSEQIPIIVGGTGLYFKLLLQGLAEMPAIAEEIRQKWRHFAGDLHSELAKRDPSGAERLKPNDRQRLARAMEVIDATGEPLSAWQRKPQSAAILAGVSLEKHLVEVPRQELYQRAEARFDKMIEEGALDEVRPLACLDPTLPAMKAIGVTQLTSCLRGEISLTQATTDAKTATRNYIKRQLTWWRNQAWNS